MKVNKIISIAVINGLTLLVFASLLASCQKNSIHSKGHFSAYKIDSASRGIASVNIEVVERLAKHFDLKQVYVYCSLNDAKVKECYQENVEKIIKQYNQKSAGLEPSQIEFIKGQDYFNLLKNQSELIVLDIIKKVDTHIGQLVQKRENFCKVNSKFYIKRCLKQYIDADTMAVLNMYQNHHSKMNGHEYLYLKNGIEKQFITKLDHSYKRLKSEEKKS